MVLWVFWYGSLIWNPSFDFNEKILGFIRGYKQTFDLACIDHRGTPKNPARTCTLEFEEEAMWYIDFSKGDDSGYIRFEESTAAKKARAFTALADEDGLIIKGHIFTLEPVTGQAEKDYWSEIKGGQGKYKDNRSNRGRNKDKAKRKN